MASVADICNIALSHLGADAVVVSISPPDGSVEAGHCARLYKIARLETLDAADWSFAKRRVLLAEVANDSRTWTFAYALPSDMVTALRVLPEGGCDEHGSADFELDGQVLRTNVPAATLLYKRDVTDTTRFPPGFVTACGKILAGYLAGPLIKGMDGAKVGAQWLDAGHQEALRAAARAANESHDGTPFVPASIAARA